VVVVPISHEVGLVWLRGGRVGELDHIASFVVRTQRGGSHVLVHRADIGLEVLFEVEPVGKSAGRSLLEDPIPSRRINEG
jgi:hypothetical protein